MSRASDGWTLLEVLLAAVLLVVGLVSVILLFPAGLKAQQMARNQMYASVKAMELADAFSQHTLRFNDRMHVLPYGHDNTWTTNPRAIGKAMLMAGVYGSRTRYDLETVASAGGVNGFYPVPIDIARRLDSPGNEIGRLLDEGAYLFYPDPRPLRGFSQAEADNPASTKNAPELQRLVFAITGYAQQNSIVQHPLYQYPYYKLWPFPPDGVGIQGASAAQNDFQADTEVNNNVLRYGPDLLNWAYFANLPTRIGGQRIPYRLLATPGSNADADPAGRFGASPWSDGWRSFLNLSLYGELPIQYKFTRRAFMSNAAERRGVKIPDYYWSKRMGLKLCGTRTQTDPVDLTTNADLIAAIRYNASLPADPATNSRYNTIADLCGGYDPALELGDNSAPRLPSLELRLLNRRLAEQLWRDVVQAAPLAGSAAASGPYAEALSGVPPADPANPSVALNASDPLVDDIGNPLPSQLHPARVLALSYLANAAIQVTGHRGPMLDPAAPTNPVTPWSANTNWTSMVQPGSAMAASGYNDYNGAFSEATADDYRKARRAQENALRWAIAYRNRFPDDHIIPCPANRQVFTDTPMYLFDLFDAAGNARRSGTPHADTQATYFNGMNPRPYILPSYFLLPRRFSSPTFQSPYQDLTPSYATATGAASNSALATDRAGLIGPGNFILGQKYTYAPSAYNQADLYWEGSYGDAVSWNNGAGGGNLMNYWASRLGGNHVQSGKIDTCAVDETLCGTPTTAGRYWLNAPFAPQARMRQIICWSVDWKRYEDAESAPSAPVDAGNFSVLKLRGRLAGVNTNAPWTDFDAPEAPLIWFGRDRRLTFQQIFSNQGSEAILALNTTNFSAGGQQVGATAAMGNKATASIVELVDKEYIGHGFGQFGADRNGNTKFDRGEVPASSRMRASEVARFNYYDPVAWTHLRN
jgi:hypothetical protein